MKNRLQITLLSTLLVMMCLPAGAQHYFGVRAGYGNGTIRQYPPIETGSVWGCKNFGVSWKYYSREKYLGGVEADLQFIQKGYSEPNSTFPDTSYWHRVNSVELPLFWQPHVYVMGRRMRVFLNLGVVFSYNIDATEGETSKRDGLLWKEPYDMILVRDNRWGYGLCGGLGINLIFGRFEALAEARYNFGYADLYKNRNVYVNNFPLRSPVDNLYFSVGAYYRFGKDGILSAPSKKVAAKMAAREAARVKKQQAAAPEQPKDTIAPALVKPLVTSPAESAPQPVPAPPKPDNVPQDGNDTPAQSSPTDTERPQ